MQKCIDGANQDQRGRLIDEIIENTLNFVRNPFGNYVLQYVLEKKDYDVNSRIGRQLLGSLLTLSKFLVFTIFSFILVTNEKSRKFSSNVIEKCLQINIQEVKNQMVKEILKADSYLIFLKDQYGNYVVQKTLAVAEKEDKELLIAKIKPEMEDLKRSSEFGQKIYNKLVKSYPSLQSKAKTAKKNKKRSSQKGQNKPQLNPGSKPVKGPDGQIFNVRFLFLIVIGSRDKHAWSSIPKLSTSKLFPNPSAAWVLRVCLYFSWRSVPSFHRWGQQSILLT